MPLDNSTSLDSSIGECVTLHLPHRYFYLWIKSFGDFRKELLPNPLPTGMYLPCKKTRTSPTNHRLSHKFLLDLKVFDYTLSS